MVEQIKSRISAGMGEEEQKGEVQLSLPVCVHQWYGAEIKRQGVPEDDFSYEEFLDQIILDRFNSQ